MRDRHEIFHLTHQDGLAAERLIEWCVDELRDAEFSQMVAMVELHAGDAGWIEWHDLVTSVIWSNNLPNLSRLQITMLTGIAGTLSRLCEMTACYSGFIRDLSALQQVLARRVAA